MLARQSSGRNFPSHDRDEVRLSQRPGRVDHPSSRLSGRHAYRDRVVVTTEIRGCERLTGATAVRITAADPDRRRVRPPSSKARAWAEDARGRSGSRYQRTSAPAVSQRAAARSRVEPLSSPSFRRLRDHLGREPADASRRTRTGFDRAGGRRNDRRGIIPAGIASPRPLASPTYGVDPWRSTECSSDTRAREVGTT